MRALLQRVSHATVTVDGAMTGECGVDMTARLTNDGPVTIWIEV